LEEGPLIAPPSIRLPRRKNFNLLEILTAASCQLGLCPCAARTSAPEQVDCPVGSKAPSEIFQERTTKSEEPASSWKIAGGRYGRLPDDW